MKKIFSLIMIVFVAFTAAFVGVATFVIPNKDDTSETGGEVGASWSGSGTSADPYLITSASDLQALATNVNAGTTYSYNYFLQTADIDLSSIANWAPIGTSSTYSFQGHYDGANYSIKNMTLTATANYAGLFGYIYKSDSTISNIIMENVNISGTYYIIGSVVGYIYGESITNCYATGSISCGGTIGGIAGSLNSAEVNSCGSAVTITATGGTVGGIVGTTDNYSSIVDCFNTGSITSESYYVGGIAGKCSGYSYVSNCYNTGSVSAKYNVGGIVGFFASDNEYSSSSYYIGYCYNTGSLTATTSSYIGGIAGEVLFGYLKSNWAYCSINASSYTYAGGILGYYRGDCLYDNYNYYYITNSTVTSDEAGGTQDASIATNAKSASWAGYSNWSISSSSKNSTWHLASTGSAFPVVRASAWRESGGTEDDPFTISTPQELHKLAVLTNMGVKYYELNFKQITNINLSSYSDWTPIGRSSFIFGGVYDGNGFTISNMTISQGTGYSALFGYVAYTTLKNIILSNSSVSPKSTILTKFAGLAASVSESSIENCSVLNSTINGSADYTGGIAGEVDSSSITNCTVSGTINGGTSNYTGGIVGYIENKTSTLYTISDCLNQATINSSYAYTGGCFGYVRGYFNITNCSNAGAVNLTGSYNNTGGVTGYLYGYSSSYYATMQYCCNTGSVSASSYVGGLVGNQNYYSNIYDCYNAGTITATASYTGGLVGEMTGYSSSSYPSRIKNCYNRGSVTGTSYVGGLIGRTYTSTKYMTMYYSYNVGTISGTSYIGGISGRLYSTTYNTVSNCYWDTGCGASYAHGYDSSATGSTGYSNLDSTTYAKSSSWSMYTSYWDFTNVWMINSGMNDGYPILKSIFAVGSGGSGTSADPFLISSLTDLQELQKKVNAGTSYSGIYFKQTANIDMRDLTNWTPIGSFTTYQSFAGNYDGDGYAIANLTIDSTSNYQGLFGYLTGSVSNLRMLNVSISGGGNYYGAVSGSISGNAALSNIAVFGSVSGGGYIGGLAGYVIATSSSYTATISKCYNSAAVSGSGSSVGGLVGSSAGVIKIDNCYNLGNVRASVNYAGGIIGNSGTTGYFYRTYNAATVTSGTYAGGIVGNAASNSYACMYYCYNVGTLSGSSVGGLSATYGTNSSSYWDASCGATYGIRSNSSTAGKTTNLTSTVKSKTWSGYANWDFSDVWFINPKVNNSLPILMDFYWDGTGTGTESDPFIISSLTLLQQLQKRVNQGEHYEGMYFKQTTTISLTSISDWTPIGDYGTNDFLWFSGYYKQQDYSIQYLKISSTKDYRGFFGYAINATFDNPYFLYGSISASSSSYVGTLVGYANNCVVDKYDASAPSVSGGSYTGAIAGFFGGNGTITNSYSSQVVTGAGTYVGGLIGCLNGATMKNCYRSTSSSSYAVTNTGEGTGGLVGVNYYGTIDNCYSLSIVTGQTSTGGLVGILDGGTISNSYHTTGKVTGTIYVGGIFGRSIASECVITRCYNTSAVQATTRVAGGIGGLLAGYSTSDYATLQESYNSGIITGVSYTGGLIGILDDFTQILNCYNTGTVTGTGSYTGGLVGRIEAYTITTSSYPVYIKYSFNKGAVTGTTYIGGIVGYISLDGTYSYIAYSYNVGALSSSSSAATIGGITAYFYSTDSSTFLTNYWDTDCGATYGLYSASSNSGATGYAALDTSTYALNSSWSLYSYWDFTYTWRMLGSSYNSGYPILLCGLTKYTITFYPNGGNESSFTMAAFYTEYITLPENTFTRAGFVANGWVKGTTTLTASPTYTDGSSYQVGTSNSFYANWAPVEMTIKLLVYVEHDIDGKTYDLATETISGFSAYFNYYNTTLNGSGTSWVQLKSTGAAVTGSAITNQSVTVYVSTPTNYICTAIVVNNETPTHSSKLGSKTVAIGTGMSGYDSSNYYGEVRVYIKKVSGNHIEYQ